MTYRFRHSGALMAGILLSVGSRGSVMAQARPTAREAIVTHASGTFEVKLMPLATAHDYAGAPLGRFSIDKQFQGDLVGTSKGEMLTGGTEVKNSAGYVAIERVSGTLHGKTGTFILQHSGTMNRGAQSLTISVVPDSGTGELAGISGTMAITIADGKHSYDFEYAIAPRP
jgi:hypothetical protein